MEQAGDVDGDGRHEVLVSAPFLRVPGEGDRQLAEGRVYLFSAQGGLGPRPDWTMTGAPDSNLDYAVAAVGDVTGDGFDDVLLGAPFSDQDFANEGVALLVAGSASGLGSTPVREVSGGAASAALGISVASAGDVDADGFLDVVVGSTTEARLFLGGPGGLPATPSAFHGGIPPRRLPAILPLGPYPAWETDVEHADVNGDGFDDVLAIGSDEILVFAGSPSRAAATPAARHWRHGIYYDILGRAGDVNGDGCEDFLEGDYNAGDVGFDCILGSGTWATKVTPGGYGCQSVAETEPLGDVDGDGYDDVLFVGDRREPEVIYHGSPTGLVMPGQSLDLNRDPYNGTLHTSFLTVAAGDLNGDGVLDLAFGSPFHAEVVGQDPGGYPVFGPSFGAAFFLLGPDFQYPALQRR